MQLDIISKLHCKSHFISPLKQVKMFCAVTKSVQLHFNEMRYGLAFVQNSSSLVFIVKFI